jgi:hypothetical protein
MWLLRAAGGSGLDCLGIWTGGEIAGWRSWTSAIQEMCTLHSRARFVIFSTRCTEWDAFSKSASGSQQGTHRAVTHVTLLLPAYIWMQDTRTNITFIAQFEVITLFKEEYTFTHLSTMAFWHDTQLSTLRFYQHSHRDIYILQWRMKKGQLQGFIKP